MMGLTSDREKGSGLSKFSGQPIVLGAVALVLVSIGVAAVALGRATTGTLPEQERVTASRLLQARTAETSEKLVEKTKAMEATQEEAIDQLQVLQDQLLTVRRLLAAQQSDNKRLSDQVSGLTEQIESLRQSFASAQSSEARDTPATSKSRPVRNAHRRRPGTQG